MLLHEKPNGQATPRGIAQKSKCYGPPFLKEKCAEIASQFLEGPDHLATLNFLLVNATLSTSFRINK